MSVSDPRTRTSALLSDEREVSLSAEEFQDEVAHFLEAANRADLFAGQYIYSIVLMSPGAASRPDAPAHVLHDELYGTSQEQARSLVALLGFPGACLDVSLRRVGRPAEHKIIKIIDRVR